MDKSEQRENMTKRSVTKNTYSYLQVQKKSLGHVKNKIISLFKINTTKDHGKPLVWWCKETKKIKKQTADNIIKSVRNLFRHVKKVAHTSKFTFSIY